MAKEWTEDEVHKKLQEIQSRIPESLRKRAYTEVKATPTIEMISEMALKDPNFPEEKKKQILILKENGDFKKMKIIDNVDVQRVIDSWVGREIKKAQKAGLLPQKKDIAELPFIKMLRKKYDAEIHTSSN